MMNAKWFVSQCVDSDMLPNVTLAITTMTLDAALELSVEQFTGTLNKKNLVLFKTHVFPGSLSVLAGKPILCPSLKIIAFFDCKVTEDVIRELGDVLEERRGSTVARLYRVVIVNNTLTLPDLWLIHKPREFVLRVDIGVGDQLPDLSRRVNV